MENAYQYAKRKTLSGKLEYPEKAMIENFIKFNADKFITLKGCSGSMNGFGISVYPDIYDSSKHIKLQLIIYIDGKINSSHIYLPHQIYMHDLVYKKWEAEQHEHEIRFEILCIRESTESVVIFDKSYK